MSDGQTELVTSDGDSGGAADSSTSRGPVNTDISRDCAVCDGALRPVERREREYVTSIKFDCPDEECIGWAVVVEEVHQQSSLGTFAGTPADVESQSSLGTFGGGPE